MPPPADGPGAGDVDGDALARLEALQKRQMLEMFGVDYDQEVRVGCLRGNSSATRGLLMPARVCRRRKGLRSGNVLQRWSRAMASHRASVLSRAPPSSLPAACERTCSLLFLTHGHLRAQEKEQKRKDRIAREASAQRQDEKAKKNKARANKNAAASEPGGTEAGGDGHRHGKRGASFFGAEFGMSVPAARSSQTAPGSGAVHSDGDRAAELERERAAFMSSKARPSDFSLVSCACRG
jgi:hypothetical protein